MVFFAGLVVGVSATEMGSAVVLLVGRMLVGRMLVGAEERDPTIVGREWMMRTSPSLLRGRTRSELRV